MKFLILAAAAIATVSGHAVNTGSSNVQRSEDGLGNYAFGYNEDHATGGTFRKEKGGPGFMAGSYGLRDADGRIRTVNYIADIHGYRASVSTNEPGTDVKQDPAAVNFNLGNVAIAPAPVAFAEPAVMAAPLMAKSYAAPVATSYAMTTQHLSAPAMLAAPMLKSYAAAPLVADYGFNKIY